MGQSALCRLTLLLCPVEICRTGEYNLELPIRVVADDDGKLKDKPFNRALLDEDGRIYDIISGTFPDSRAGGGKLLLADR